MKEIYIILSINLLNIMNKLFTFGAINKETNKYESLYYANKNNTYKCPSCDKDIILKDGPIRERHFSHLKSDNPCVYYNNPTETDIHKNSKLFLKSLIEKEIDIKIIKTCTKCNTIDLIDLPKIDDNSEVIIEHPFMYNGKQKYADLCIINKNTNKMIILEIFHTHQTDENDRPEPWYEIKTDELFDKATDIENHLKIKCTRSFICNKCIKNTIIFDDGCNDYSKILENIIFHKKESGVYISWVILHECQYEFLGHFLIFKNNTFKIDKTRFDECTKNDGNDWSKYNDDNINKYLEEVNKFQFSMNGRNLHTDSETVYDKSLVEKLISYDLINLIFSFSIRKGSGYVIFNNNFDKLNNNEQLEIMQNLQIFWKKLLGEYSDNDIYINFKDYNGFPLDPLIKNFISIKSLKKYSPHKIYFNVAFKDKEKIKKEGGIWDNDKKCWYIIDSAKNKEIINKCKNEFTVKSI